jgi:hypothetical protein
MTPTSLLAHVPADPSRPGAPLVRLRLDGRRRCLTAPRRCEPPAPAWRGNFFDIWNEPVGPERVGPATGHVTAFFDGRHYLGNPRDIPLLAHAQIQLDVGRPLVGPESIQFPPGF